MDRLRTLLAWLVAVTLLLAHPVAGLGSCRRCPPDCPMHVHAAERAEAQAMHPAPHHAGGAKRCHDPAPRAPEDGPCLSGVCGHMDAAAAPVLPDGVLLAPKPLAVMTAALAWAPAPVLLLGAVPRTPPTEPPRSRVA